MSSRLVTVATYCTTAEAALACDVLESEGIACRVGDEMLVEWLWCASNAVGGVKVMVLAEDAERASAILAERSAELLKDLPADSGAESGHDEDAEDDEDDPFPGDVMATHAWRAAIIGFWFCPPLFTVYSVWTLLRLSFSGRRLSRRGTWRFYGALLADVAAFAFLGFMLQLMR